MLAGHDTSSTTLTSVLANLQARQRARARARARARTRALRDRRAAGALQRVACIAAGALHSFLLTLTSVPPLPLAPPHLPQDNLETIPKLRAEQAAVIAAHGDGITGAALKDCAYADAVIR